MKVLVAPDNFKGSFTAPEVTEAICAGIAERAEVDPCPIADGGDGTASVLLAALGGEWRSAACHDALGRPIEGRFALLGDGARAVVEVAEASGLARLERAGAPLEALAADSAGAAAS